MFERVRRFFRSKGQSEGFQDENWHLDILMFPVEEIFLSSSFPKELEIIEWVDNKPSKIDNDYYDITWMLEPENRQRPGLFIAFMHRTVFEKTIKNAGKPPDELCKMKALINIVKHDEPNDRKSHPEWQCWLEVTDAKFRSWCPEC
jgi:hypothetical protein